MNVTTIAQIASTFSNIFFAIFAVGCYLLIKVNRRMAGQSHASRIAMGRPQIIVMADYSGLPRVDLIVRNVSQGAAKEITVDFSAPIKSSDRFVISDLAYYQKGLDFLEPGGEIRCYWDDLGSLVPTLREQGFKDGITVAG